jgi:hypothetical protein
VATVNGRATLDVPFVAGPYAALPPRLALPPGIVPVEAEEAEDAEDTEEAPTEMTPTGSIRVIDVNLSMIEERSPRLT